MKSKKKLFVTSGLLAAGVLTIGGGLALANLSHSRVEIEDSDSSDYVFELDEASGVTSFGGGLEMPIMGFDDEDALFDFFFEGDFTDIEAHARAHVGDDMELNFSETDDGGIQFEIFGEDSGVIIYESQFGDE